MVPLCVTHARRALIGLALIGTCAITTSGALGATSLWTRTSNGLAGSDVGSYGISALPDGGAIVTGYAMGAGRDFGNGVSQTSADSGASHSAFTEKLAASGAVDWVRLSSSPNATYTQGSAVSAAADGTSVVTGYIDGNQIDLGDGVLHSGTGRYTYFIQKFAADGNVAWAHVASAPGGSAEAVGYGVATLSDGSTITTGYFQATAAEQLDLGDGTASVSASSGAAYSVFTQKRDSAGSVLWTRRSGGTGLQVLGKAVAVLPDGSSIVTSVFGGSGTDFGDGAPRTSANSGASNSVATFKLAPNGTVVWVRTSSAPSASNAEGLGVSAQADGTAVVAGKFTGVGVDLGDGIARTSAQGGTAASAFSMKLAADGTVVWVRTSPATSGGTSQAMAASAAPSGATIVTGDFSGSNVDLGDGVARTSGSSGADSTNFVQRVASDGTVAWTRVGAGPGTSGASAVSARDDGNILVSGWFMGAANDLGSGVPQASAASGTQNSTYTEKIFDATSPTPPAPSDPGGTGASTPTASPTPTQGPAATAPGRLQLSASRTRGRRVLTSGVVPDRATRVVQIATGGGSSMARLAFGAHANARVLTSCPIRTSGTQRVFTCNARLGAGRWTLTTQARAGSTVVAQVRTSVTVRATLRGAVTG
jgi:hypothetical protein